MDTKGRSVFARQEWTPPSDKLDEIFKKCHGTRRGVGVGSSGVGCSRDCGRNDRGGGERCKRDRDDEKHDEVRQTEEDDEYGDDDSDDVPHPENTSESSSTTWLIHPSPVSEAALDFAFQTRPTLFSPYSATLFSHLIELRRAFTFFVVADFLWCAPESLPSTNQEILQVLSDVDFVSRIDGCLASDFERSMAIFLALGVVPTVTRDGSGGTALGVADTAATSPRSSTQAARAVPNESSGKRNYGEKSRRERNDAERNRPTTEERDEWWQRWWRQQHQQHRQRRQRRDVRQNEDFRRSAENYLKVLQAKRTYSVISTEELRKNTLLTFCNGTYGCSDYRGRPVRLWTFGSGDTVFGCGYPIRGPFLDMMQHEYQYVFANDRHRHQTVEKMTQTRVIVSSSFTKEVETTLENIRKVDRAKSTPAAGGGGGDRSHEVTTAQDKRRIDLTDAKAELLKTARIEDTSKEFSLFTKQKLEALQATLDINASLSKGLRKYSDRDSVGGICGGYHDREDGTVLPQTEYVSCVVEQPRAMLHDDDDDVVRIGAGRTSVGRRGGRGGKWGPKVAQEALLAQNLAKLHNQNAHYKRETTALREEVVSLLTDNAQLRCHAKIQQARNDMSEKKLTVVTNDRDRTAKVATEYHGIVSELKATVQSALERMNAGDDERARLLRLFASEKPQSMNAFEKSLETEKNRRIFTDFLEAILGSGGGGSGGDDRRSETTTSSAAVVTAAKRRSERKRAYDLVLKKNNVSVVPFFTAVRSRTVLDSRNYSLPHEWMHDVPADPLNEANRPGKEGTGSVAGSCNHGAVTTTPELYILDMNPKSDEDALRVKRVLEEAEGATLPLTSTSVFERSFLNVQFPTQGGVRASINDPLKEKWHHLTRHLLRLSTETYTRTGQKIGCRVGVESVRRFVVPFATEYVGRKGHEDRVASAVAAILYGGENDAKRDGIGSSVDGDADFDSSLEKLVCLCMEKIKTTK